MSERYDIVTARQYVNKDGELKTAWTLIGSAWSTAKGWSLTFDALPVPQMSDKGVVETRALLMPPRGKSGTAELPSDDAIPY